MAVRNAQHITTSSSDFSAALMAEVGCAASVPTALDAVDFNKLLKWVWQKSFCTKYPAMRGPFRLVAITDSAFRAEEPDCLALRGAVIVLVSMADSGCPWAARLTSWSSVAASRRE